MMNGVAPVDALYPLRVIKVSDQATLMRHWPFLHRKMLLVKRRTLAPTWAENFRATKAGQFMGSAMGRARWEPEQIRYGIQRGFVGQSSTELFFFIEGSDSEIRGFIVTTMDPDPFKLVPMEMHIFMAWTETFGLMERAQLLFDGIMRERGVTAIETLSARPSLMRRLRNMGYRMKWVTYRRELEDR